MREFPNVRRLRREERARLMSEGTAGRGQCTIFGIYWSMDGSLPIGTLTDIEISELTRAKQLLENPGLAARLANTLGAPIEKGFALLPKGWSDVMQRAVRGALLRALEVATATIPKERNRKASPFFHKLMVGASGGLGGAFGLIALPVELPVSTAMILRSIAEIAQEEGHDLSDIGTRLHCLEVFALGGRSESDDAAESLYWAVRAALGKAVSDAASYLAERTVLEKSSPAVVRLITTIASRFGVVVSEQLAAKAVPIVGAAGGSIVNVVFMDHFQDMARGHFIVKRLEAKHGVDVIRAIYNSIAIPIQ